jgi:uncharacterized HhH-GPD family protein
MALQIAQEPHADAVLTSNPFALLAGMMLDQQFPMERAFAGPAKILDRFGSLDPRAVAAADPEQFAALCAEPPAVHRFPGSMAGRLQALGAHVVEQYDGDTARLWAEAESGADLLRRVKSLPGFGGQKAKIFVALLGKQWGVTPPGWRDAAGDYGADGTLKSVADVVSKQTLLEVRAYKQAAK